jgi:hypothetical protein
MRDPLAIVRNEYHISIAAAIILGVALLLSASLGFGGTIVQNVFGQFNIPPLPGENTAPSPPPGATTTTTKTAPPSSPQQPSLPQGTTNGLTFLDRGLIGTTLHTQGGGDGSSGSGSAAAAGNKSTFVVAGIFRIYSNESLVQRFVAEMNLAAIDGTAFHNVTVEETSPHRFKLTETANGNATTTTTANNNNNNASTGGSIPPVSSQLKTRIFVDGNAPVVDNVPMTISIRGQVLAIQGISIDASTVTDPTVRNVLSIINGHSLYGTVLR